jgi:ERCC4-type nuclease
MLIIIDKRETALYEKCRDLLAHQTFVFNLVLAQRELPIGDILIQNDDFGDPIDYQDILLIERKTFPDLLSSIKDGRYEEQSHRLLNTSELPPHSIIYLLEGMFSQLYNPKDKKIIYSAMTTIHYFKGCCVYRVSTIQESAEWILFMADKLHRELEKKKSPYYYTGPFLNMYRKIQEKSPYFMPQYAVRPPLYVDPSEQAALENAIIENKLVENSEQPPPPNYCNFVKKVKKDNITPENIGEIILCQIPGISSVTAITIMKQYGTFPKLIEALRENPNCLDGIACESTNGKTRKISKSSIENIRRFLV